MFLSKSRQITKTLFSRSRQVILAIKGMAAQVGSATEKKVNAGKEAAHLKYTTLYAGDDEISRDQNHKFIVQRNIATSVSRTIKDMFDGNFLLGLAYTIRGKV